MFIVGNKVALSILYLRCRGAYMSLLVVGLALLSILYLRCPESSGEHSDDCGMLFQFSI